MSLITSLFSWIQLSIILTSIPRTRAMSAWTQTPTAAKRLFSYVVILPEEGLKDCILEIVCLCWLQ